MGRICFSCFSVRTREISSTALAAFDGILADPELLEIGERFGPGLLVLERGRQQRDERPHRQQNPHA